MPVATTDSFRNVSIQPDNITVQAEQTGDTLTLVAGAGITLVANAGSDQITIVNTGASVTTTNYIENPYSFNVAGDDSTLRLISNGETLRFASGTGISIASDSEGKITISNAAPWTGAAVTINDDEPQNPVAGQMWFVPSTGELRLYTGAIWYQILQGSGS